MANTSDCQSKFSHPTSTSQDQNNDPVTKSILNFILSLHSDPSVSRATVQKITEEFSEVIQQFRTMSKKNLKKKLPQQYHKLIDESLDKLTISDEIKTEYKRFEYLKKKKNLILPETLIIGEIDDDRKVNHEKILTKKKCEAQVIPMRQVLKSILELPNFFKTIIEYIQEEEKITMGEKVYSSIISGSAWDKVRQKYGNKIVIPLYIYYDDFESGDPLSSSAGIHKIGGLYYSFAVLPEKYRSSLENIFLAQFCTVTIDRNLVMNILSIE